jgi:very-short-patch-repair endonuclease
MPKGEKLLWSKLRRNNLEYKFRRQFGIKNYILDFYCIKLKLAIEVDGISHTDEKVFEKDCERQGYLESLGIKVIRFNSEDVFNNLEQVVAGIYDKCKEIDSTSTT